MDFDLLRITYYQARRLINQTSKMVIYSTAIKFGINLPVTRFHASEKSRI